MEKELGRILFLFLVFVIVGCGSKKDSDPNFPPSNDNNPPYLTNRIIIQNVLFTDCHGDIWENRPGNCDGIVNPKEDIYLVIVLKNDSYYDFHNVSLQVLSSNAEVAIECQKFNYGNISAGNSKRGPTISDNNWNPCDDYGATVMWFRYLEMIDSYEEVMFDVVISSNEGTWYDSFVIAVYKTNANLIFQKFSLVDSGYYPISGNANGLADPGEKVGLSLMIRNTGTSSTQKVRGSLKVIEGSNCVNIEKQNLNFGNWLDAGNSSEAKYYFGSGAILDNGALLNVSSGCVAGTKIKFSLKLFDMYGNQWNDEFVMYLSQETSQDFCGDGYCSGGEDCNNCPEDCGTCSKKNFGENCSSNEECSTGICINWSQVGEGIKCGQLCSKDSDCPTGSCCVFETTDGKKNCVLFSLATQYCKTQCQPNCSGKQCGSDGCGGSCGSCDYGKICNNGQCVSTSTKCHDSQTSGLTSRSSALNSDSSCKDFYSCYGNCTQNDQICVDNCYSKATPAGQQEIKDLVNCLQTNSCSDKSSDEDFIKCLEDFCLDQYFKCFSGDEYQTCKDLVFCLWSCPENDNNCISDCFTSSSYQANWDYQYYRTCIFNLCTDNDFECINNALYNNCKDKSEVCIPAGPLSCSEVIECTSQCSDNECFSNNFYYGTFTAQKLFNDLLYCLDKACPDGDNACLNNAAQSSCKSQYDACMNQ
ncbi:MAG: hypothetical protein AB1465_06585 [Patescibacteria group bacterium]